MLTDFSGGEARLDAVPVMLLSAGDPSTLRVSLPQTACAADEEASQVEEDSFSCQYWSDECGLGNLS